MSGRLVGWFCGFAILCILSTAAAPTAYSQKQAGALPAAEQALAKVEAALARKVSLNAEDMPLREVISKLAAQTDVPIILARKIEDAGVTPLQPVTFSLRDVPLRVYLRNLLEDHSLSYVLRREVIIVTTEHDADSAENVLTRVYPVKDLLVVKRHESGWTGLDFDPLLELIRRTINEGGWQNTGGSSSVNGFGQAIVLTTRPEVHDQVVRLLAVLRHAKTLQAASANGTKLDYSKIPVSLSLENLEERTANRRIEDALQKMVSYKFAETPLHEVVAKISTDCGVHFLLTRKIEDAGVNRDGPVSIELAKVSLRTFLERLLGDLNLTFQVRDGLIRVTTVEDNQSPENMVVRAYPVRDLVESETADGKPQRPDFDPLADLILSNIEPDSWGDGVQGLPSFETAGVIVIAQRDDIHEKVGNLIAALRKARADAMP